MTSNFQDVFRPESSERLCFLLLSTMPLLSSNPGTDGRSLRMRCVPGQGAEPRGCPPSVNGDHEYSFTSASDIRSVAPLAEANRCNRSFGNAIGTLSPDRIPSRRSKTARIL